MTYNFEALDDEKFQKLCQAILITRFPDAICLPVGQPDGGRDAYTPSPRPGGNQKEFFVFQVKYSRSPDTKEARDVISDTIKSEASKVEELKKRGASRYYLLTNVRGTAHLDKGSIDKASSELMTTFGLPAECWWRDDLEAGINSNSDIKWSFPEIIRGSDLLQLLIENAPRSEQVDIRMAAIRSYIAAQQSDDEQVKFKQVGLQNGLLELFVDLPARAQNSDKNKSLRWLESQLKGNDYYYDEASPGDFIQQRRYSPAAATLLRHPLENSSVRVVMEGAPGQGKSTITQYLCQVNRLRFLNDPAVPKISPEHLEGPIRLPFRIDLRDYASWLQGKNPFSAESATLPPGSQPGLESFISAQVTNVSGGHAFSVSDFTAISKTSHILIVLDGFDEVADINIRKRVVDEITKAAVRVHANSKSAQIIVTSRPSAFANSPGFTEAGWQHIELQSMLLPQISTYAKKWMTARQLPARERTELEKLLREKLEQPHMRDLARNPMQLTILLALIQQRGLSLPDKRTALYDSYMDLFFSREAEKSSVVRAHRDLLIDVHRYLAWRLQGAAEKGSSSGAITEAELRSLLTEYLTKEGHKTGIVDDLFTGMVERVVALVSRVEGTFEFEVQPLREYFAAKHLYETAPYSPAGQEKQGTTPERFSVLASNFYWLNVVRFFSGCFSKGELTALADCVNALSSSTELGLVSHPHLLALMLLGDWVFSQQPLAVERVVASLFERRALKLLVATENYNDSTARFALPDMCGREQILDICFSLLTKTQSPDETDLYVQIIVQNGDIPERQERWQKLRTSLHNDQHWIDLGLALGILAEAPINDLREIYGEFGVSICPTIARARRFDLIYQDAELLGETLSELKKGNEFFVLRDRHGSHIEKLGVLLRARTYGSLLNPGYEHYHAAAALRQIVNSKPADVPITAATSALAEHIRNVSEQITSSISAEDNWASSLKPWETLVSVVVKKLGPNWAAAKLAITSAGIRSTEHRGAWDDAGWQIDEKLCSRLRYARLKAGNVKWWKEQFGILVSRSGLEQTIALATFLAWATPKTIGACVHAFAVLLERLPDDLWHDLSEQLRTVRRTSSGSRQNDLRSDYIAVLKASKRSATVLFNRSGLTVRRMIAETHFSDYEGSDPAVLELILSVTIGELARDNGDWMKALPTIRSCHLKGADVSFYLHNLAKIPLAAATEVCSNVLDYPRVVVALAQQVVTADIGARARRVSDIAERDGWFS